MGVDVRLELDFQLQPRVVPAAAATAAAGDREQRRGHVDPLQSRRSRALRRVGLGLSVGVGVGDRWCGRGRQGKERTEEEAQRGRRGRCVRVGARRAWEPAAERARRGAHEEVVRGQRGQPVPDRRAQAVLRAARHVYCLILSPCLHLYHVPYCLLVHSTVL